MPTGVLPGLCLSIIFCVLSICQSRRLLLGLYKTITKSACAAESIQNVMEEGFYFLLIRIPVAFDSGYKGSWSQYQHLGGEVNKYIIDENTRSILIEFHTRVP